jgi:Helix-turn-helix domain
MGRAEFGQLIRETRKERGRSLAWVASMLSHPPHGPIWTGSGVRQLQNGQRRVTRELCDELIAILELDADEAYAALGWWPKGVTLRDIQQFRRHRDDPVNGAWIAAG